MGRAIKKLRSKNAPEHVVLLVHGIRTQATWNEMVKKVLEDSEAIEVQPVKYGFVDTFRFLFPWFTRKAAIDRFVREYRDVKLRRPNSRISVIAHSFGTYIFAKALEQVTDIVFDKVVLCGSIIPNKFRVAPFRAQLGPDPILNDCGTHDVWPVLAKSSSWGYGSTGTFGFGTNGIRDRFHKFTHSSYFDEKFVKDFWLPYLLKGSIKGTEWEVQRPNPPYWQSLLGLLQLKWILPILLVGYFVWPIIVGYSATPVVRIDSQIFVGQWVGVPQAYARLHISNGSFSESQIVVEKIILAAPDGRQIPIYVERINNCDGSMPLNIYIIMRPRSTRACDYELLGDTTKLGAISEAVDRAALENKILTLNPDLTRTIFDGHFLKALMETADKGMIWIPGTWKITIEYGTSPVGGSYQTKSKAVGLFDLTNDDVSNLKNVPSYYKSGVGVFYFWRNWGPAKQLPVKVDLD